MAPHPRPATTIVPGTNKPTTVTSRPPIKDTVVTVHVKANGASSIATLTYANSRHDCRWASARHTGTRSGRLTAGVVMVSSW